MKLFREDNTEGYTAEQMDALNNEWDTRATELELEEYTDEYNAAAQQFCDDVSRRLGAQNEEPNLFALF